MNSDFNNITEALIREGFHALTETTQQSRPLDFKITPYSLNTSLSFKFENLAHFVEFLRLHDINGIDQKIAALQTTLNELSLDSNQFFYVNFFEKDKEIEM